MRLLLSVSTMFLVLASVPTLGADDELLEQLVTCRVSWLDWKSDPVQANRFAEGINGTFVQKPRSPGWTPRKPVLVGGLQVVEAFPESVGMGVGFSLAVDAGFDKARAALEKLAGRTFKSCESGDGMKSCELPIADKRTLMIVSNDTGKSKTTLIGCYYYYAR